MELCELLALLLILVGIIAIVTSIGWSICEEKLKVAKKGHQFFHGFSKYLCEEMQKKDDEIKKLKFELLQYEIADKKEEK